MVTPKSGEWNADGCSVGVCRSTIDYLGHSLDAPEVAWAARRDATPGLVAEPARDIRCLDPSALRTRARRRWILSGNLPTALGGTSPAPIKPPLSGRGLTTITHERPGGTSKVTSMEVIGGTVPGDTRPTDRIAPVGSSATIRVAGRGLLLATGMTKRRQPGSRVLVGDQHAAGRDRQDDDQGAEHAGQAGWWHVDARSLPMVL